ncbi:MAG TPA: HepT-like ribonuclease domain-containing protein [Methanoregulaceae archaeon]|nr:HepT-like ribonuclease domain-containing protein [Methanoregulaceae archaeon]
MEKVPVQLREEIMLSLNARYPAMRQMFGIKKIGIFGSVARGEERPESDIDIEVEFEKEFDNYRNFIGLSYYLEELLGRKVDLVTTRVLARYLRPDVGSGSDGFYRDEVYAGMILDEMAFLLQRKKTMDFREFSRDEVMKRAVSRSLEIIGDSVSKLSQDYRQHMGQIPWRELESINSRFFHTYFGTDWNLVWSILEHDIPKLEPAFRKRAGRKKYI